MKTAGDILRDAREKQERTLEQIAKQTRIKEKFLEALEKCDWASLPNFAVAQGFARSYAQTIGANSLLVIALLRRDFPQHQNKKVTREISFKPKSIWTPKATIITVIAITVFILSGYLAREYFLFAAPPLLELEEATKNEKTIFITGKTIPTATVEANGKPVLVDEKGVFKIEFNKNDLINSQIEIQAVSRAGKKTTKQQNIAD